MDVRSLGYRTDLIFSVFNGEVTDRGEYLAIRTPSNPTYYWGNFLLFSDAPRPEDFDRWRTIFTRELGPPPTVGHEAFGWDTTQGEVGAVEAFLDHGFTLVRNAVLTASRLAATEEPALEVDLRRLRSDEDWGKAVENQVRCREPEHRETAYREFKQRQMVSYRAMAEAGKGDWFGAFIGEDLVADLGLYHAGKTARYQSVETHPAFRRRGIAGNLVRRAGQDALDRLAVRQLVIVAEPDSAASRLYSSLGFELQEWQVGLERALTTVGDP